MMNRSHLIFCSMFAWLCLLSAGPFTSSLWAADEEPAAEQEATEEEPTEGEGEESGEHGDDEHPAGEHDDHAEAEGDHHGEEHPSGPPLSFRADLALWSFISFGLLILVLKTFAWGPLIDGLDNREAKFRNQLAEAEAARIQAEKMLKEHAAKLDAVQDEVKAIIDEARRDAEHTKNDIIEQAQKEAKATQDRAVHEIERSRDAALKELFDTMSSQVAAATEHVIGRSLDGDDQNRLIDEALSQFSGQ
ncbi:MAG: F0F1 ATP synthase subunit B [Planctomycetaceae bacterium]|nr:F0F1 ATP synthase subunit B [Planctomycetaceae bacterium]